MNRNDLYSSFQEVDDDILTRSEAAAKQKAYPLWLKWGALAACLCIIMAVAIPAALHHTPESPNEALSPGDGPPSFVVNGVIYVVSSYPGISETLPEGFVLAGETNVGGFEDCPYYTNPNVPEWVFVYHEVTTDGTLDEYGVLNRTEPHGAYVRYVHERLRGRDLVCYNGEYYISMWSADSYGNYPDVTHEYWNEMLSSYDVRIEGSAPEGFASAGVAEFSGYDTIPRGDLVCNTGAYEIFANPDDPNVILVPTRWYTAPIGENGETSHSGFNVYIRYDCPFA